jgi:cell wall-associated NlpC family hydrolase
MGDVIAQTGSAGLHYEVLKNGQRRNPMYFAITNDDGGSDIPPGEPGGAEIPEYPGAPMDDARFAAMIEEAQKHLDKPYVFGASGPDKFDCSGFICYVLNNSGVANVGRTNAQGLYNLCTPVSRGDAQPGDLIFFTGTYNAGRPVTHVGLYIGNGKMIHAGKPVQYSSIDTRFWKEHFYSLGRLP